MVRGRPGPRRRRGGARRHRRPWVWNLGGALLVAVAVAGVLGGSAWQVRGELQTARAGVAAARQALAEGRFDAAVGHLDSAGAEIDRARARTRRLLWRLGSHVPVAGRSLRVVIGAAETADAAVTAVRDGVVRMDDLLGGSGELDVQVSDGQVELAPIETAHEMLTAVPVDRLEAATARLRDLDVTWLPDLVRDGRRDTLELADQALATFRRARTLTGVLPAFLGGDGSRRYLLALQNNAELRGTGGLIGVWGTVEADAGALTLGELRPLGDLLGSSEPVDAPDAFAARYAHVNAAGFFTNVNVDPDLPTVAPVMLDLARARTGLRYDGLIAVDPLALEAILGPVGPIEVPEEAVSGYDVDVPRRIPPGEIAEATMVAAVPDRTSSEEDERDRYLTAVGRAAFDRLLAGSWETAAVVRGLADATAGRHLQLYSADGDEQTAFERLGVAGQVRPAAERGDLLALSANNAAGNKMDVHVGHSVAGTIDLRRHADRTVTRHASLQVSVDNPLPTTGMDETIIGSMPTSKDGTPQDYTGPVGLNRTWFSLWAPQDTGVTDARAADGRRLVAPTGSLHGHTPFDHFLETASGSTSGFAVELAGPAEVDRDGPDLVYRLTWWHQAKAVADRLDLRIGGPDGWDVAAVEITGGGDGGGMGVHGDPGPEVSATIADDGTVVVRGDASRDVTVEIRYARGLWQRLREWLRTPAF